MSILVIAEHSHAQLSPATLSTLTAATQFHQPIQVLVAGTDCQPVAASLQTVTAIEEVLVAEHAAYQHGLAEAWAPLIQHILTPQITHILAPATTFGKNILPRLAALLNTTLTSDVIAIIDQQTYQRPIYAGNAIATVRSRDVLQLLTVRPTAFAAMASGNPSSGAKITAVNWIATQQQTSFVREEQHGADRPDLSAAAVIIAGGRGVGDKAAFARLTAIADRLHAAIGASRAAVDAGLAPNDWQVGQTGKVVAPKLYIAVGISGAIQHLAGMKDSQTIVAINKDPDAPIFQIADYGLVADIPAVLNEWEAALDEKTSGDSR